MAASKEELELERKIRKEIEQECRANREDFIKQVHKEEKRLEDWRKSVIQGKAEVKEMEALLARAREQFALIESQAKANDTEEPTHHSHQSFGKK